MSLCINFDYYINYYSFFLHRSPSKGPNTENALAKRVRFGARIVTKNGRDAHRELNGFFFSADRTLTLYEFHQFGTRLIFTNVLCVFDLHINGFLVTCNPKFFTLIPFIN